MNLTAAVLLFGAGIIIIVGLAAYALMLRKEVKRRETFRLEEEQRAQQNSLENLDYIIDALLQEQVNITEASWRCKVLLEIIDPSLAECKEFGAFATLHDRTRHLKTHSERNKLTPRERMREDKERLTVEDEMRNDVMAAAKEVAAWRAKEKNTLH
ncbi:DUF2489 domain-containing protein [Halomonas vilamensis]|uniref:DUF2489 domain-containing protein n=1 Tax=Vreelandella vilamensis TaxID=531309 RepID=A0ABU1H230_9GAMM|nr:DUF2489 domain-containing protein [Halomonas vilamensis]MDR5898364.1 DUF2489 domain-containing protein [Halomonas vilamensis]